jgi:hypothetical protein
MPAETLVSLKFQDVCIISDPNLASTELEILEPIGSYHTLPSRRFRREEFSLSTDPWL